MLCYEQQSILFRERTKENSKKNVCIKQLKTIINNQSERNKERLMEHLLKEYKEYFPLTEINHKSMIELLRLPFFATKEDILKELNEIL